jgi:hypothetical protein
MQLVMRRSRLERGLWDKFRINARMVVSDEETGLLDKYKLHNVTITPGDVARDMKKSAGISFLITLALFFTGGMPPVAAFILFAGGWLVIYHQIREEVRVKDLLTGRDFQARSFLDLLIKEQRIRKMSALFANVIDQARGWDEPEVVELEPEPLYRLLEGERAPA